ncbi:MAG: TPM domain-containing protein, partial [Verrucomicrobiia bacterium]
MRRFLFIIALLILSHAFGAVYAAQLPPPPSQYIVDNVGVLQPDDIAEINRMLADIETETSCQVVVAIYNSLPPGESLEDYANRLFRAWGIGRKDKNNGVLLLIYIKDRKLRIEVGYGLEGSIPDATAKRIIDENIVPFFRTGKYSEGIKNGIRTIYSAIKGEYKPARRATQPAEEMVQSAYYIPFIDFILFWVTLVTIIISRAKYY